MSNDKLLEKYDAWLNDNGPSAIVIREYLMPVEGNDGVIFPATFAASQDGSFKGGYNIDSFPDGKNVCLIDSVGSQANRIEPIFMKREYAELIPQFTVLAGDKRVNLLEAGHRAGDAIFRCSGLKNELRNAFLEVQNGNDSLMAELAPTSIVFGVWDSRDTQAKLPRLISSTIRAFDVRPLTRSATYIPPVDHIAAGNIPDYEGDKKKKDAYSARGWLHALSTGTHGGVIADGDIRRDAVLHLAALRLRKAGNDENKTLALRRYILGLALIAFTATPETYLRQGCNIVLDTQHPRECKLVFSNGSRDDLELKNEEVLSYAKETANEFGINSGREVQFIKELAKNDIDDGAGEGRSRGKRSRA
jgi:CRISPR-associated protein Csb1